MNLVASRTGIWISGPTGSNNQILLREIQEKKRGMVVPVNKQMSVLPDISPGSSGQAAGEGIGAEGGSVPESWMVGRGRWEVRL